MNEATLALTIMSGLMMLIFLGFLIWGIKTGQFKNIEEPKYRMMQNDLKSDDCRESKDGAPGNEGKRSKP